LDAAADALAALIHKDPQQLQWQRDLAYVQTQRAWIDALLGRLDQAEIQLKSSLAGLEPLEHQTPQAEWVIAAAIDHLHLADIALMRDRQNLAREHAERALAQLQALPNRSQIASSALADVLRSLGEISLKAGKREEALLYWGRALDLLQARIRDTRDPPELRTLIALMLDLQRTSEAAEFSHRLEALGYKWTGLRSIPTQPNGLANVQSSY
jgi:tetratricopeptide (TPR) repeat protein